ncbi:MAG TPA: M1 family metallopeptidase [Solirubrobacterales bacterium]|nr:M1 family metallopeptidase [Solirubrobacterales bacterium]
MRTVLPRRAICLFACAAAASLLSATAAAAPEHPTEPFFPRSGDRGYDVRHYEVSLGYQPRSGELTARDVIEARATSGLRRFSLDLDGLEVTSVSVDGEPARYSRGRGKVKIVPATPIVKGEAFTVRLRYQGVPRKVTDPDGSTEGWYRTGDGAVGVGEPVGTATWLACDNTPRDKAGFEIQITVPAGTAAVSNGRLVARQKVDRRVRFTWAEPAPMATYLALVDIGKGKLRHGHVGKLPTWTLVDPRLVKASRAAIDSLPEIIRWESHIYGPYPFAAAGSAVDVADLEYALETQTRPIYAYVPDRTTVVHETAHQWFGDSVGLERWPNIWLNEGFATWTQWYFAERHGGRSAQQVFARLYRRPAAETGFWNPPSGHPGRPQNLFATSTYVRGAMTLQALRDKIGTHDLLRVMRTWARDHRHGHGDIEEFIALSNRVSGEHLRGFFHRWLFRRGKP